jgi:hypothetical protein
VARFDPGLLALLALLGFAVLLATTAWAALGAVALALGVASVVTKPDREPLRAGLVFAAVLGGGALAFGLGGGLGLDMAARRAVRAVLLVATATWLRGAAGAEGLREVSRRMLARLRRIPSAPEAAAVLDEMSSEGRLAESARALERELRDVRMRPLPVVDAVLRWVVVEAESPRYAGARAPTSRL